MNRRVSPHRVRAFGLVSVVALLVAGAALPTEAHPRTPTRLEVVLHTATGLDPDGQTVFVNLIARCPEGWTVLESSVTVSQPQASGKGSFPLTCTDLFRSFSVAVPTSGAPFELGEAQATGFVLVKRGRTAQTQDSEVVSVDPIVFVDLADTALLEAGGAAVLLDVTTACAVGASGQQSYVNVSQGQTSGNGNYVPVCNGQSHTETVRVPASQGLYQPGTARGFSFAFVEFGGNSFSGIGERDIQIVTG
jgi:hypothetical protein